MPQSLRRICRLYGVLLFAYPREFRLRFGREMAATFSDQIWDEWNQSGLAGIGRVWRGALWELFSIAMPLRMRSTIVVAATLSFLGSSALSLAFFRAVSFPCSK
jgi:hypothetical protein